MTVNSTNMLDELRAFYHDIVGTKPVARSDSPTQQASARRFKADKPFSADDSGVSTSQLKEIQNLFKGAQVVGISTKPLSHNGITSVAVNTDEGIVYVAVRF